MATRQASRARPLASTERHTTSNGLVLADVPASEPLTLSIREAARRLGVGHTVLYPHVMSGTLPSVALGKSERRVLTAALPAFLQTLWEQQREALAAS